MAENRNTRRDDGMSLLEILVAIVLIGVSATAVLTTLRVSIASSAVDRDVANALGWLQTASDKLELHNSVLCTPTAEGPRAAYETELRRSGAEDNGDRWPASLISVESVKFWNGSAFVATCSDRSQLVRLKVASPNGRTVKFLDVVKVPPVVERVVPAPVVVPPPPACTLNTASIVVRDDNGKGPNIPRQHRTKTSHLKYKPATITMTITGTCNHIRVTYTTSGKTYSIPVRASGTTYSGKISPSASEQFDLGPLTLKIEQANLAGNTWSALGQTSSAMIVVAPA